MEWMLIISALFVAFSNGANDNFKGFATVWGSNTLSYRAALTLATFATVAGSVASLFLAEALLVQFSGKGLVPEAIASSPAFITSVSFGAALTVFMATRLGLPVSTTHALIGGLIGAGLAQSTGAVHFDELINSFLLPLLLSPILAAAMGIAMYRLFSRSSIETDCACVVLPLQMPSPGSAAVLTNSHIPPKVVLAASADCDKLQTSSRISVTRGMDKLHIASAISICFARGVNDTPKLAALLVAAKVLDVKTSMITIAAIMALGGILFARKVAVTMSQRVSRMNHAQGLGANLITAGLVLFASKLGMPVSTTHVSVGSIAGVGAGANTLDWSTLRSVLLSWLATLPLAMVLAFGAGLTSMFAIGGK